MNKITTGKIFRKSRFTLFELLISVGLLVVLSVVLLRTLVLTSDYWMKTDEQAQLQADAKTFFTLLSDDLGNLIYTQKPDPVPADGYFYAPMHIENNRLCMITHSKVQSKVGSKEAYSDVCKVIYRFVAPSGENPGRLERMCSSDAVVDGNTPGSYDMSSTNKSTFYSVSNMGNTALVIDTAADFQATAYSFGSDGEPDKINNDDVFTSRQIRMIHVKIVLLPVNRFREYNSISGTSKKNAYLAKHGRTFYKTFWINPNDQ